MDVQIDELQQQIIEAERRRDEALATEEERQRREREPLEEAARAERLIAELQSQQRSQEIEHSIQTAKKLAQDCTDARSEMISELNLLLAHFGSVALSNLQRSVKRDMAVAKQHDDYANSVRRQIHSTASEDADLHELQGSEREQFVTQQTYQRTQQLGYVQSTETALDEWFDLSKPGSKDALLRAVILYFATDDKVYLESWEMSQVERKRHRHSKRWVPRAQVGVKHNR